MICRKACLLLMVLCMGSSVVSAQTFSQTLASLGYEKTKCVDWSDSTFINIPKPTWAYPKLVTGWSKTVSFSRLSIWTFYVERG